MIGVHAVEVDFVLVAIEAEPHGLGCLTAIQIVFKDAYYPGDHPAILSAIDMDLVYRGLCLAGCRRALWGAQTCVLATDSRQGRRCAGVFIALGPVSHFIASVMDVKNLTALAGLCLAV